MACGGGGGGDGVGVGGEWEGETGVRVMGGMRADQLFHIQINAWSYLPHQNAQVWLFVVFYC